MSVPHLKSSLCSGLPASLKDVRPLHRVWLCGEGPPKCGGEKGCQVNVQSNSQHELTITTALTGIVMSQLKYVALSPKSSMAICTATEEGHFH